MSYRPVTIEQNGQKVLIDLVPLKHDKIDGVTIEDFTVPTKDVCEPCPEVRKYVNDNCNRSFNLHKVENGEIVCRTIEELEQSTYISWQRPLKPQAEPVPNLQVVPDGV